MSMLPADTHRRLDPPCPACDDTGNIYSEAGNWLSACTICEKGGSPRHPAHHMVRARLNADHPPPIPPATYPSYGADHQSSKPVLTETMPEEWRTEPAAASFVKSYNGEGSYYCPRCNDNQGSVWLHSDWRPTKWQALCPKCRPKMRGAGGQSETQDSHVES